VLGGTGVDEQGNDETVQTQDFGENENENHADEESWLLSGTPDTSITDDTDGETSGETGETDRQTGTELDETSVQRHRGLQVSGDQDRDDQTVDGNNTRHDDGNDALHHEIRSEDTHGRDTDARLGGTVTGTDTCEDDGRHGTHGAEEWRIDWAELGRHGWMG